MEFSQLIINYPEDKLCLHYTSSTPIAVAVLRKMQQILPLLLDENGLSLKFRRKVKSKDSRLKSKVKSKFASKPKERFVNCDGAKTMTVCRVND